MNIYHPFSAKQMSGVLVFVCIVIASYHGCSARSTQGVPTPSQRVRLRHFGKLGVPTGHVEVLINGTWGAVENRRGRYWPGEVVDHKLHDAFAGVVCRMLGYKGGRAIRASREEDWIVEPGRWAPIVIHSYKCNGTEESLFDCDIEWAAEDCDERLGHRGDREGGPYAAVNCDDATSTVEKEEATPPERRVRLSAFGRRNVSIGHVEVWVNGQWGAMWMCPPDDGFAKVICRQLGYQTGTSIRGNEEPIEGLNILIDDIYCKGSEKSLFDCEIYWAEKVEPYPCNCGYPYCNLVCDPEFEQKV